MPQWHLHLLNPNRLGEGAEPPEMSLLKEQPPEKIAIEKFNGFLRLFKSCEYLHSFPWKKG